MVQNRGTSDNHKVAAVFENTTVRSGVHQFSGDSEAASVTGDIGEPAHNATRRVSCLRKFQ
jgi:hypothetical protein